MKTRHAALLAGALSMLAVGCQDFLDVNENPNAPQSVGANTYLPAMLHWMASSPQWDGRYIMEYTQQAHHTGTANPATTWGRMGYDPLSDNGGQVWRDVYWTFGQNLIDMMDKARAEERWDVLGVGYVLKAWGWQSVTDLHGELIIQQAFDQTRALFDYDTQEFAYKEVRNLLDSAIVYLQKTDGRVDPVYLGRGDKVYNGDRTKWLKFAYGLYALNLNHLTAKSSYDPTAVIAAVDKSLAGNADDALMPYTALSTDNADRNFWGQTRQNQISYRQTGFVLSLMDGTVFGAPDPRMTRMLAASPDGQYRGIDVNVLGYPAGMTTAQRPNNFFGYVSEAVGKPGVYLFSDKSRFPIMTYAQLQFVKAEAAFRKGDKATALAAYKNGVSAHIDFVNDRNRDDGQWPTQIAATEKAAFLADVRVVPTNPADLTLTQIMTQKYIAQWFWGHIELWTDMRRFHYTDLDPATGKQVYPGFAIPTTLYVDNNGKPAYRLRPRYNSEYVWNRASLEKIGGLLPDFHTKPIWILEP